MDSIIKEAEQKGVDYDGKRPLFEKVDQICGSKAQRGLNTPELIKIIGNEVLETIDLNADGAFLLLCITASDLFDFTARSNSFFPPDLNVELPACVFISANKSAYFS